MKYEVKTSFEEGLLKDEVVCDILADWDPVGLVASKGNDADGKEYDTEASAIVSRYAPMGSSANKKLLGQIIYAVLDSEFNCVREKTKNNTFGELRRIEGEPIFKSTKEECERIATLILEKNNA